MEAEVTHHDPHVSGVPGEKLRHFWPNISERKLMFGLVFGQAFGVFLILAMFLYSVLRWRDFDRVVAANSENIRGINEALYDVGIVPRYVPAPDPDR
jgi:hypothetical protein